MPSEHLPTNLNLVIGVQINPSVILKRKKYPLPLRIMDLQPIKDALEACGAIVTEYNLNDQTVSGMRLAGKPVFSVQYHPEAAPAQMMHNISLKHFTT